MRLLLALAMTLLLAAPASAATVQMREEVEREDEHTFIYGVITVTAAPGEANALELAYDPGARAVVIRDAGAPLTGDADCAGVDAHTVRCDGAALDGIIEVHADLGDGADTATSLDPDRFPHLVIRGGAGDDALTGRWATLEGGDGNDVLRGDTGVEVLHGDAGNDVIDGLGDGDYLHGGAGDDTVRGGAGNDTLLGGTTVDSTEPAGADRLEGGDGHDTLDDQDGIGKPEPGRDVLDGGAGGDSVYSYILRRAAVTVDLSGGTGGEPGEDDTLTGIEHAFGGAGDDTLIGDDGPNRLDGDRGRDVVRGGGGDDRLVTVANPREDRQNAAAARYGPDRLFGDAGDDVVEAQVTLESAIACGDGNDVVRLQATAGDPAPSSPGPLVSRSCERLTMADVSIDPFPAITRRGWVFGVHAAKRAHRIELQTVARRPRPLGTARLRRPSVRIAVRRAPATVRAKITRVAHNRFVWRMRRGF